MQSDAASTRRKVMIACVVLAAAADGAALAAQEDVLTLSAGADFTSGDYGKSESTEVLALQLAAKYETGRWTYRLSLPWLRISGPSNVIGAGAEGVVLPGQAGDRRTVSGLGDLVAGASYNLIGGRAAPFHLDAGAKLKLGTADEAKGLGTGENDFSLQVDVFKPIGNFMPFATLGHRWYGDPQAFALENALYGSLGAAYVESAASTVGMSYDFRQRIVAGGARVSEVSLFLLQRLERRWKLQMYFVKGLADASPDAGGGVVLQHLY